MPKAKPLALDEIREIVGALPCECGAMPGLSCRTNGQRDISYFHSARYDLARSKGLLPEGDE